jgi:dimethylargininase
MLIAVTRPVSPSLAWCELTHLAREPIDVERAAAQHEAYEILLGSCGATVVRAPAAPESPDAVFIEDTAIVLDEVAVVTRPGAPSRRAEVTAVALLLAAYRPVRAITAPGTLDGGDVLRLSRALHVGRSGRTNDQGIEQLRGLVAPYGYQVVPVDFTGCLHLKSAVTAVADEVLLVNPAWVPPAAFPACEALRVDEREPHGANALRVAGTVVYPAQFPRTRDRLAARGLRVATTDCRELAKAEGAVTCCSLLFEAPAIAG